jgi:2',3'-cyclic-nucleotide 2'-phosphodiesterase (5'-nucleotidase family)
MRLAAGPRLSSGSSTATRLIEAFKHSTPRLCRALHSQHCAVENVSRGDRHAIRVASFLPEVLSKGLDRANMGRPSAPSADFRDVIKPLLATTSPAPTRRSFTLGVAASALAAASPRSAGAGEGPDLLLILMADLHSGYAYSAALVKAVRDLVAANRRAQAVIVVNGDVFELGNALCLRNNGKIDLEMLRIFASLAPTIVNIGNHDGDIVDPQAFVAQVGKLGATLVTNIADPRTGAPYGPPSTQISVKGRTVKVTALGTPALGTYRNGAAWYSVPQPGPYAASHFTELVAGADFHLALVHAGFQADTAVLPSTKAPFLLHGGHDHLRLAQKLGTSGLHIHSGYWSNGLAAVRVSFTGSAGVHIDAQQIQLTRASPQDPDLALLIARETSTLLDEADLKVLGQLRAELALDDAALFAAEAVRKAAGADIGFLSHTTFGDGLPAGPVTAFDLASFVRFDGGFTSALINGAKLADAILPTTNQFDDFPYARRTGDFLYSTARSVERERTYKVAVNSFATHNAANMNAYFRATDIAFAPIPSLQLKSTISAALAG